MQFFNSFFILLISISFSERTLSSTEFQDQTTPHQINSQLVQIKIKSTHDKPIQTCSGTLIRFNSKCKLLTNNHCFDSSTEEVSIKSNDKEVVLSKNLHYFDSAMDLAVVPLPDNKFDTCEKLPNYTQDDINKLGSFINSIIDKRESVSLKSTGFVGTKMIVEYTSGLDWKNHTYGYEPLEKYFRGDNNTYFLKANNLKMFLGMSGGPIYYNDFRLLGIKSFFVNMTNVTYFIPLYYILNFIHQHEYNYRHTDLSPDPLHYTEAENSGTNGSESEDIKQYTSIYDVIQSLSEPAEGIRIKDQKENLVALATSKNVYHIDGWNDYRWVLNNFTRDKLTEIYPSSSDFIKDQKRLFLRVFPENAFAIGTSLSANLVQYKNNSIESNFLGNPVASFFSIKSSSPFDFLNKWNPTETFKLAHIELSISNFQKTSGINLFLPETIPAKIVKIEFSMNLNNGYLTAKDESGDQYSCKNKTYFKIICIEKNKSKLFSFSRRNVAQNSLVVRFAEVLDPENIIFYYGSMEVKNE